MSVRFTDRFVLMKIKRRNVYYDKHSIERSTKRERNKFKILNNSIDTLKIYIFFPLTSQDYVQIDKPEFFLTCEPQHWEDIHLDFSDRLNSQCSYLDIRKVEEMTEEELLTKLHDSTNSFRLAGTLCDVRFADLQSLLCSAPYFKTFMPNSTAKILGHALHDAQKEMADHALLLLKV